MELQQQSIPAIFTANTYFWSPAGSASSRRRNEERNQQEAFNFFKSLGFDTKRNGDSVVATGAGLEIEFSYSESCKNVYKHLSIYRNGKKSNITALKKFLA